MTETEMKKVEKSMAYDLKLLFKEKLDEGSYKEAEAIIDAYIAGSHQ